MFAFQILMVWFIPLAIVQQTDCKTQVGDQQECGKPAYGACNDNQRYMCPCHPTELFPNCTKYPPKVKNVALSYNVTFMNGSNFTSITVHWQANKGNNDYGLEDMWGFQVYAVAMGPLLGQIGCKQFDSKKFKEFIESTTGNFAGYFHTFNHSVELDNKYEILVQPLPAESGEKSVTKKEIFIPDICYFPENPKPPLSCCKVINVTLERISQDKVLVRWNIEEKCLRVKGFLIEGCSVNKNYCTEPARSTNPKTQTDFNFTISLKNFIEEWSYRPFQITVKCLVGDYKECKDRSSPVLLDLLDDCVVIKPFFKSDREVIAWNINKPQCSVVLGKYNVDILSVSELSSCKEPEETLVFNASIYNVTFNKDFYKPGCTYKIIVTCVYQNGSKCKESDVLYLEVPPNQKPFKLVVSVLASILGAFLVLILFMFWYRKRKPRPPDEIPIIPTVPVESPTKVGISHDSGNCEPCRQAVHNLASVLNSTGYFDCMLDLWCVRSGVEASEFNRDLIESSDCVLVVHSHNSAQSSHRNSDVVELEDFRNQQSFINETLTSNDSSRKFISVCMENFLDQYRAPSCMLRQCEMFVLPGQLENMIFHMLEQDPQCVCLSERNYNRLLKTLKEKVKNEAFHYKTRCRQGPVNV